MGKGIFITGTDTGVGKTFISACLGKVMAKAGYKIAVMKPIQTGSIGNGFDDTEILMNSISLKESNEIITPYSFKEPVSPHLAAGFNNINISLDKILDSYQYLIKEYDVVIVEGIGGLMVPLNRDDLLSDLIKRMDIPIIIISKTSLGTINHTLLTINYALSEGIVVLGVILNNTLKEESLVIDSAVSYISSNKFDIPLLGVVPYIIWNNKTLEDKQVNQLSNILDLLPIVQYLSKPSDYSNYKYIKDDDKRFIWHPFTQMQEWIKEDITVIKHAKGIYLYDTEGKRYMDGNSSYWVNIFGHQREEINQALLRQIKTIAHSTFLGLSNIPAIELAKRLVSIVPKGLSKVFYSDNGSTAVEVALKMSFQYWKHKAPHENKNRFVAFRNAYHGDTLGCVGVGGIETFHSLFSQLLLNAIFSPSPYCYRCPMAKTKNDCNMECLLELEMILKRYHNEVAALIIEPIIQCPAGIIVAPKGFLRGVRTLCTKYNIIMIADEVATGFGRTGAMFACEHEDIVPDIITLSKALTGGYLPLAATICTTEIYNAFMGRYEDKKTFFHGHTFTGNQLGCSASLASINLIQKEGLLERVKTNSAYLGGLLHNTFNNHPYVGDIRQCGFFCGIELVKDRETKEPFPYHDKVGIRVGSQAKEHGLIIRPLGNIIVLAPPLVTTQQELESMVNIISLSINASF